MERPSLKLILASSGFFILAACNASPDLGFPSQTYTPNPNNSSTSSPVSASQSSGSNDSSEQNEQEPNAISNGSFYFSYDDSASTASYELTRSALELGVFPQEAWGRPYEYLNAVDFQPFNAQQLNHFSVSAGLQVHQMGVQSDWFYQLGIHIEGPTLNLEERDNLVLTLLIDTSGSMAQAYHPDYQHQNLYSNMDLSKFALSQLQNSLKSGDVVNLVEFNTVASEENVLLENWHFDASSESYQSTIDVLTASGSTNLEQGISLAYQVASRNLDPAKNNVVLLLTDAYANSGDTEVTRVSELIESRKLEGIRFSGLGVGWDFNEAFLDGLTEAGNGSYASMITPSDASRLFNQDFISLIDYALVNVQFQLHYPSELTHLYSAAEELSEHASEVERINFSYNSEQFFSETFLAELSNYPDLALRLDIDYFDPQGQRHSESLSLAIDELIGRGQSQIAEAIAVRSLAELVSGQLLCSQVQGYADLFDQVENSYQLQQYRNDIDRYCSLFD